jgi:hypothetical protein
MNRNVIIIIVLLVFLYLVWGGKETESFAIDELADMETDSNGSKIIYSVTNDKGKELVSSAFTPVMCDTVLINSPTQLIPKTEKGWSLKMISKGIYVFEKPSQKECLYAHSGYNEDSLRSYATENCNHRSLCGLETLDFENSIDENSLRTYFRIIKLDNNKFNIISVKNNKYVCLNDKGVYMKTTPDQNCQFYFTKI